MIDFGSRELDKKYYIKIESVSFGFTFDAVYVGINATDVSTSNDMRVVKLFRSIVDNKDIPFIIDLDIPKISAGNKDRVGVPDNMTKISGLSYKDLLLFLVSTVLLLLVLFIIYLFIRRSNENYSSYFKLTIIVLPVIIAKGLLSNLLYL